MGSECLGVVSAWVMSAAFIRDPTPGRCAFLNNQLPARLQGECVPMVARVVVVAT
jgi:hypothetical protein